MILEVKELTAGYIPEHPVVKQLSFSLKKGETLGLCGASGCGKTTVIWAILGMLRHYGGYAMGEILYQKQNLLYLPEKAWRLFRWKSISIVSQYAMNSFNPVFTMERTFVETLKVHRAYTRDWRENLSGLLEEVRLDKKVLLQYPHELSGGMKQRAALVLALLLRPALLILDEATTGLDVVVEADILKVLWNLQQDYGLSMLFVSHDQRIVHQFCHQRIMLCKPV